MSAAMMTETRRTRLLIISDTHTTPLGPPSSGQPFRSPLPAADVLLHAGDLTMQGGLDEYRRALEMLSSIQAGLKLVIAGNHDLSLDGKWWAANRGTRPSSDDDLPLKARELWTGPEARKAGVTYLDEGTYSFRLRNGGLLKVYATPYQPEFYNWAFPYFRNQDRFNPPESVAEGVTSIVENPVPDWPGVDVLISHGPPQYTLDSTTTGVAAGCAALLTAVKRARPKVHCFGHIHEGWGARVVDWEHGTTHTPDAVRNRDLRDGRAVVLDATDATLEFGAETLFVNASIMDVKYKPLQPPFVVDLDLPVAL